MKRYVFSAIYVILISLTGCNAVGPKALHSGRMNYNEVIAQSWNEQLLLNLVRLKYRDTLLFLEINNVSTQYTMNYSAGASPSFAPDGGSSRSLGFSPTAITGSVSRSGGSADRFPFDAGISFNERPTISYTPLQGGKFVKQLLSAIPVDAVVVLSETGWSLERILGLCVQRMNGLENAATASGPTPAAAPRFEEFAEAADLLRKLQLAGGVRTYARKEGDSLRLIIRFEESPSTADLANELKVNLGLDPDTREFICLPGIELVSPSRVTFQTRSLLGVFHFLSNAVEVPENHRAAGLVTQTTATDGDAFDWSAVTGDLLKIKSQESQPDSAFAAVHYRGSWFYIDDADLNSKSTFGLLTYLFYYQAGEIQSAGPTLTLPL
jgi:hypothetical protein